MLAGITLHGVQERHVRPIEGYDHHRRRSRARPLPLQKAISTSSRTLPLFTKPVEGAAKRMEQRLRITIRQQGQADSAE